MIAQGPLEGDRVANGRVEMAVRLFEFPLNKTQVYVSQMTAHYSVGFLVLQRKS